MDFKKELFELQEYCKASANFITDNDSIEDRYARQAYKDVAGKIALVFQRVLAETNPTSQEQLATPDVSKCEGLQGGVLLPFDFIVWYSGMEKEKIERAYQRYLREVKRQ